MNLFKTISYVFGVALLSAACVCGMAHYAHADDDEGNNGRGPRGGDTTVTTRVNGGDVTNRATGGRVGDTTSSSKSGALAFGGSGGRASVGYVGGGDSRSSNFGIQTQKGIQKTRVSNGSKSSSRNSTEFDSEIDLDVGDGYKSFSPVSGSTLHIGNAGGGDYGEYGEGDGAVSGDVLSPSLSYSSFHAAQKRDPVSTAVSTPGSMCGTGASAQGVKFGAATSGTHPVCPLLEVAKVAYANGNSVLGTKLVNRAANYALSESSKIRQFFNYINPLKLIGIL